MTANPKIASTNLDRQKRGNLGYVGLHAILVSLAVFAVFLNRYLELLQVAKLGYGPNSPLSSVVGFSAVVILVDAWVVISTRKSSRGDRMIALGIPGAFLALSMFILLANLPN